jgi:sugar phosphate isomerase/epimerase
MAVGLSTYAFFWQHSDRAPRPLSVTRMLEETAALGGRVFQICDYPAIETTSDADLAEIRRVAEAAGIRLELGTRGVTPEHLRTYLDLATKLDVTFVRSMLNTADHRPSVSEAVSLLRETLPSFAERGVTIGLETYEQVATTDLVTVIEEVASPYLGVCLDPANSVARLELPSQVIDLVAPYVVNMHVKDFAFTRQAGWVGFSLVGCPLGEGLLDYDAMVETVRPDPVKVNQVVEHWLPWQGSFDQTCQLEQQWTRHAIDILRSQP